VLSLVRLPYAVNQRDPRAAAWVDEMGALSCLRERDARRSGQGPQKEVYTGRKPTVILDSPPPRYNGDRDMVAAHRIWFPLDDCDWMARSKGLLSTVEIGRVDPRRQTRRDIDLHAVLHRRRKEAVSRPISSPVVLIDPQEQQKIALASNRSLHSSKAPFTRKRSYGPVHLCHEAQTRREIRGLDRLCSSVLMLTRRHRPSTRTRRHCGHGNIIIAQRHLNVPHSSQLRGERRRSIVHCHCCHCGGAAALLLRMSLDSPAVKLFTKLG
jgi:hypothetical protein